MVHPLSFEAFHFAIGGWSHNSAIRFHQSNEATARQGVNRVLTTLSQLAQFLLLSEQISLLEGLKHATYLPSFLKKTVYFSIPLVGGARYLLNFTQDYPKLKNIVKKLEANMGTLFQIASAITTIAFFQFGYHTYACFAFASFSIDFLVAKKIVPSQVRCVYLIVRPWLNLISHLFLKDWWLKAFAILEIFSRIKGKMGQSGIPYEQFNHVSCLKSYNQFEEILSGKASLEVNREHVNIQPFPETNTRDFSSLITLCHNFDWSNRTVLKAVESALKKDARWEVFVESEDVQKQLRANQSAVQVDYLKEKFRILIESIQNEKIETGEPLDYGILKNYLGYLTEHLPLAPLALQQEIMIALAVEGGDYCGPGIYNQLEMAAMALLQQGQNTGKKNEKKRLPFKQRLLLLLQQDRLAIIQAYHVLFCNTNPAYRFFQGGQGDIHAFNYTIGFIGREFGLPQQGADQDKLSKVLEIERLLYRCLPVFSSANLWEDRKIKGIDETKKYRGYTSNRIVGFLKGQSLHPLLPTSDFYHWALDWMQNLNVSDEIKRSFYDKLQDGVSFSDGLHVKKEFIEAMLVDMGILKVVK